jgi:hypothetical protein
MISPLLHLLQRGDSKARIQAVTEMAKTQTDLSHAKPPTPWKMRFLSGGDADAGDMDLAEIVRHYPQLSILRDPPCSGAVQVDSPQLLVIGVAVANVAPPILEAMAAGIVVVIPDEGEGANLVRDGINGFHYRARNPDSLALTLLTIEWLPADFLLAVLARAHVTFNSHRFCRPDSPKNLSHGHGEPV